MTEHEHLLLSSVHLFFAHTPVAWTNVVGEGNNQNVEESKDTYPPSGSDFKFSRVNLTIEILSMN